jgi:hypothetical protein
MPRFEHQYIAWTDEGKQSIGGAANIYMWRQRGAEAWLEECMVPKFPKAGDSTVLYWIAFTYRSKCPLIFWDHKNWGNIDQWSYIEHILPTLRDWLRQEEEITGQRHWVVQDNAPSHKAKNTKAHMAAWDMRLLPHPASSPDLNLAENPIGIHQISYPQSPRSSSY